MRPSGFGVYFFLFCFFHFFIFFIFSFLICLYFSSFLHAMLFIFLLDFGDVVSLRFFSFSFFFFKKKKTKKFLTFVFFFVFLCFQSFLHSGRSKVTRVTVGRDTTIQSFRVCKVNLATLKVATTTTQSTSTQEGPPCTGQRKSGLVPLGPANPVKKIRKKKGKRWRWKGKREKAEKREKSRKRKR